MFVPFMSIMFHEGRAQSNYDPVYADRAGRLKESLMVFTDRDIYVVNENIRFSAVLYSGLTALHSEGSRVLYVELVNSGGIALSSSKYPITGNWSAGYLPIPSTLLTGQYYLRCYTRWMRNFGPRSYSYVPLRMLNPYTSEVEVSHEGSGTNPLINARPGSMAVSVSTELSAYRPGEMVEAEISLLKNIRSIPYGCVTVVPAGAIDTVSSLVRADNGPGPADPFRFNFIPEIRGMSVSGAVIQQGSQQPLPDTRIYLSILGKDPLFFATNTGPEGRFLINIPSRQGNQEMFVVPGEQTGDSTEVLIDNDFTTDPLPFQPEPFHLGQDEYPLASRLSFQMQLENIYLASSPADSAAREESARYVPFYGNPEITVILDEFVNLPNLQEVIENLVPKVLISRRKGRLHFIIESENPVTSFFSPLVLVDHIPVFEIKDIMAIPPSKIDRIEVVPELYVRGSVKFGGIISIFSRQGDFAGIRLPAGSYFFDYPAFQPVPGPLETRHPGNGKIPDTRNTIFWTDHLELNGDRPVKISFRAPFLPGKYHILFRGISRDGSPGFGLNSFMVE